MKLMNQTSVNDQTVNDTSCITYVVRLSVKKYFDYYGLITRQVKYKLSQLSLLPLLSKFTSKQSEKLIQNTSCNCLVV